jgi:hypothetical protein
MRLLVDHIERAFPQVELPPENEIEWFIRNHEDPREAESIRTSLTLPFNRRDLTFADPSFIFWASGRLMQFMLGTYLLTLFDDEINEAYRSEQDSYRDCVLILLGIHSQKWPFMKKSERIDVVGAHILRHLTVYQCCVVADCVRHCTENLKSMDKYNSKKALEYYWDFFPPMSDWPDVW